MVTIEPAGNGSNMIHYHFQGGCAEYLAQLRALASALSVNKERELNDDERQALSSLLLEMLPNENQLKLEA